MNMAILMLLLSDRPFRPLRSSASFFAKNRDWRNRLRGPITLSF